jgi:hypothetical protein
VTANGRIIDPMSAEQESLERAITGALRSAIRAHGPITPEHIGSAVKRIVGQLANAKLDGLARALGRRRWHGVSSADAHKIRSKGGRKGGQKGGRTAWAGVSKAERSAEMKRRAAVREANREAKP